MYITVPFIMKRYSSETKDTALGKVIHDLLSLMPTKDNTNVARDIKAPLMHLLGLEDLHINYSEDKVEIRFTPYGEGAQTVNVTLNKNSENFVEELEDQLIQSQVPFQISTKYINSTYNGKNYNEMIGEIAEANIEKGQTRTISNWFITSPLVAKNTEGKTVPPSNKVRSENTTNPEVHELTYTSSTTHKKMKIFFNKRTGALTDEKGKEYSGEKANLMKAWATGQLNGESMTKPYLTNWGMYDPVHHKFISKETVQNNTQSSTSEQETSQTNSSQQELTVENTKPSIINTQEKETVWNALSEEQQSKLYNLKGKTQENALRDLIDAYDPANNNFIEDIDYIIGSPKYRKEDKSKKIKVWDQKKELAWLNKILPQLSKEDKVRIYEGLIEIVGKENAEYAWGKFEKGIITISDIAASGTLYHEAFHAVVNMLMSDKEKAEMFRAAQEKWGNLKTLELEENLAEAFRRYVQLEESPILGTLVKWFRKLKHLVQSLIGKEPYLNNLFYRINNGKYREQALHSTTENNDIRYRKVDNTVADYTNKIENLKKQKEVFKKLSDIINGIPSTEAVVFYRGEKRISKYPYTSISYNSRTEAESHIPAEFKDYFEVYENKGKYSRYFKYAKNKSIAVFEDKIKEIDKEIENLEKAREKSYNRELSKERIEYLKGNESESYSIKNEEADYREIEQYHRDKLEYGNLSKEQKAYLTDRKLTIEDYNRMTTTEKNILWKCR